MWVRLRSFPNGVGIDLAARLLQRQKADPQGGERVFVALPAFFVGLQLTDEFGIGDVEFKEKRGGQGDLYAARFHPRGFQHGLAHRRILHDRA